MSPRSRPYEKSALVLSTIRTAERLGDGHDTEAALADLQAQLRALSAQAAAHHRAPAWDDAVARARRRLDLASTPDEARKAGRTLAQELQELL